MVALGRMGFDRGEIEASISSVLNLSRATGTDLAESADIAANSMRIFGLEAGKMTQVTDVLTVTANGSAQTLADLFEGVKMAGPQVQKTLREVGVEVTDAQIRFNEAMNAQAIVGVHLF